MFSARDRAAIGCDMLLTALVKMEMGCHRQFGAREEAGRVRDFLNSWLEEYASDSCNDAWDHVIARVFEILVEHISKELENAESEALDALRAAGK